MKESDNITSYRKAVSRLTVLHGNQFHPFMQGRVLKFGPEFKFGSECFKCSKAFICPWIDYYDCRFAVFNHWFGLLDIDHHLD